MQNRPRTCAAIIRENQILMVFHERGNAGFWTLPGGGVEAGETLEEAVVREVKEEVCLTGRVERLLFERKYSHGPEYCFLVNVDTREEACLGEDPELVPSRQLLKGIGWFPLEQMRDDIQVSLVMKYL